MRDASGRAVEPIYRTGEVAELLGVSHTTVITWGDRGRLAFFALPSGHRRYRAGDVEAFRRMRAAGRGRERAGCAGACQRLEAVAAVIQERYDGDVAAALRVLAAG